MTRIDDTFVRLRRSGKKAFVSYIMAGDPDVPTALAVMPYGPTFWASGFGMVKDRFGIHWMITTPGLA